MPSLRCTYDRQDRDSSVNSRTKDYVNVRNELPIQDNYYEARNMRPLSFEELSRNALNNFKGLSEKLDLAGSYYLYVGGAWVLQPSGLSGHYIIGSCNLRNITVLFATNLSGTSSSIWSVDLHNATPQSTLKLHYVGNLGFSASYPIGDNAIGRYESEDIQKVYWADGNKLLRYCNIADLTLGSWATTDFDLVNNVTFSKPYLSSITSGNLYTGVVQYAYRLYKLNGPETIFSPSSELIPLTDKSESTSYSDSYRGQSQLDSDGNPSVSGKGLTIKIDNIDTDYERIEVIAIHYKSLITDPVINIVGRYNSTSSITFTDDGSYNLGTYTLSEFRTLGGIIFVPKTITSKDNILFAGNVKRQYFDVDFDARAYRFNPSRIATLYNSAGSIMYYINGVNPTSSTPPFTSWLSIPETADCVNSYNDILNDGVAIHTFIYQTNGSTIGGEGPNIKYSFDIDQFELDDNGLDWTMRTGIAGTVTNPSFKNYASPYIKTLKLGYRRDETYRFGIVFINAKGQESFPKWIGDIRFPRGNETQGGVTNYFRFSKMETYAPYGRALYLKVCLKSALPSGTVGWKIVRVIREEKDKTILCGGLLGAWKYSSGSPYSSFYDSMNNYWTNVDANMNNTTLFHLMSPEINFYKNIILGVNDYIDPVCKSTSGNISRAWTPLNQTRVEKHRNIIPLPGASYSKKISDGRIYEAVEDSEETPDIAFENWEIIGTESFRMIVNRYDWYGNYAEYVGKGTCFVGKLLTRLNMSGAGLSTYDHLYVNYKRRTIQYEGNTYYARLNNTYIPCSTIFTSAGNTTDETVWGGDTYIAYFDYLYSQTQWINNYFSSGRTVTALSDVNSVVYFPCETSINLNLRHDDCLHRIFASYFSSCLREKGNNYYKWTATPTATFPIPTSNPGWTDLYLYNSVYSKENDSKIHISKPLDFIEEEENDVLIMASREKYNNEERDSWLRFDNDENIEVDSQYGPIEKLLTFKNHVIFFQHNGVGTVSVQERALIQGVTASALELGTGKVLDRYDMLDTGTGVQTKMSVVQSPNGFYWFDMFRKEFYRYSGQLMNISMVKGASSWFYDIPDSYLTYSFYSGVRLGYDPVFKEIIIARKDGLITGESMIYNEAKDEFTGIYDYTHALIFFNSSYKVFSTYLGHIFEHNVGNYNEFYGTYKDSSIIYIVNPAKESVCVFNAFEFNSEVYDAGGNNLTDETIYKFRMQNDYQDSTELSTVIDGNIKRRMRTWRFIDLRDYASRARMRDSYLKLSIKFEGSNNRRIIMHPLTCHYMIPAESLAP